MCQVQGSKFEDKHLQMFALYDLYVDFANGFQFRLFVALAILVFVKADTLVNLF